MPLKVATASILSAAPGDQRMQGGGANVTGRMHELDWMFDSAELDLIGAQEGRLSTSQVLVTDHYKVTTAAAIGGNYGNQL